MSSESAQERRLDSKAIVARLEHLEKDQSAMIERIEQAVEKAIEAGMEKAFIKVFTRLQERAVTTTGRWVLLTLLSFFRRWLTIGCVLLFVGNYAGWPWAVKLLNYIFSKG